MHSMPLPPWVIFVPSFRVTASTVRTRWAGLSPTLWPCGSWQVSQLIGLYSVVTVVFATVSMKPDPVWQPTQPSRPAPEGSVVATACREFTHSPCLMWWVGASWQIAQVFELRETEISTVLPPDFTCWLPGPWQFSHWISPRFFSSAGTASYCPLPGVGKVQFSFLATSSKPPLSALGSAS